MKEKATGRESPKFMLRLPDGMRERIAAAAKAEARTMNAEIVTRLQDSFDLRMQLPLLVQLAVDEYVKAHGGTAHDALVSLVMAGKNSSGTVFNVNISPGATYKQLRELMKAAEGVIPADAKVWLTTKDESNAPTKPRR